MVLTSEMEENGVKTTATTTATTVEDDDDEQEQERRKQEEADLHNNNSHHHHQVNNNETIKTIEFNPLPKHLKNNKKHKRVKPLIKLNEEQKEESKRAMEKQLSDGFERIFYQKFLKVIKDGGPKINNVTTTTTTDLKKKQRASLDEVKEFAANYVKHAPPLPPKAEQPAGRAMRHALMFYYGFDIVDGTMVPEITFGEKCSWDEGIEKEAAHRVFIDSFRLRVDDELVFANNIHANAKDVLMGTIKFGPQARNDFATYLRLAREGVRGNPSQLPAWWQKEDDRVCQEAEILHERFQKQDAKQLYGEETYQNLRVLAELVLGTPIGSGIPYELKHDVFKDKLGVYYHDCDPRSETVPSAPSKQKQTKNKTKELSKERVAEELDYLVKGRKH
jgi:hypothetical protein